MLLGINTFTTYTCCSTYTTNIIKRKILLIKKGVGFDTKYQKNTMMVNICQNTMNTKVTLTSLELTKNTFSIGTILRYVKVKQAKYIRRSIKGTKIFLSFVVNFLQRRFMVSGGLMPKVFFILNGFDFNINSIKRSFKNVFKGVKFNNDLLFLTNMKISFTKQKGKKIKSIKKRLKKKILLDFLKSTKVKI